MDERTRSSRLWGDDDRVMMEDRGCFLPLHFYNSVQEMVSLLLRFPRFVDNAKNIRVCGSNFVDVSI